MTLRVARAAKVIGMPVTQAQCADVHARASACQCTEGDGRRSTVTPPSYRFDLQIEEDLIEEVVRADRLRQPADHAAARRRSRRSVRQRSAAQRACACATRWPRWATRKRSTSASSKSAGSTTCRQRRPDPRAQPDRQPLTVMRSSLLGTLCRCCASTWTARRRACACSSSAACSCATPAVGRRPHGVAGVRQPMRVAAWPTARSTRRSGAAGAQRRFLRRQGRRRGAARAARRRASWRRRIRRCIPGRCARDRLDGERIGVVGELHPRWRQAYELPAAPILFELDAEAVQRRARADLRAGAASQQSAWRDIAVVVAERRHACRADGGASPPPTRAAAARRDAVRHLSSRAQARRPALRAGENSLAVRLSCCDDERTLTDEQIERRRRRGRRRARRARSARACASNDRPSRRHGPTRQARPIASCCRRWRRRR